jgi:C-terminal AAA-associated domain
MRKIPSREIPQADTLDSVLRTVDAVAGGGTTYQAIGANLGLDERQGRYYRLAAELLGFVRNVPRRNRAMLTPVGRQLVSAQPNGRTRMVREAVLRARLIQRVISFLESKRGRGASREEIEQFVKAVTEPTTAGMIHRRVSTAVSWLKSIGVLQEKEDRFVIRRRLPTDLPVVEYDAVDEPLSPPRDDLQIYEEVARRARDARSYLPVLIDEAARERANDAHRMLTNLVARRIREAGAVPKRNKYVDLSTVWNRRPYLFEIKSTRRENAHDQIRRAVSQLYEYRYLQDVPSAKLVVVVENPLPGQERWLLDYLVRDRELLIAWDGDRRTLAYPAELNPDLRFLA